MKNEAKPDKTEMPPVDKSLRRRLIAFGAVAGLVLLVFLLRLAQFQFFGAA